MSAQGWNHKAVALRATDWFDESDDIATLTREGWELVAVVSVDAPRSVRHCFKRPYNEADE